jgi:tetratricopeptide (TPR) repeat protein
MSGEGAQIETVLAQGAALELAGDLAGALGVYEAGLGRAPDHPDLLAALGALAGRMDMPQVAAGFWERVRVLRPDRLDAVDGLARALRELGQFDAAIETLRAALMRHPEEPRLWAALGVTLTQDGRADEALVFFDEAVRLDPSLAGALYNRANARFDLGDLDGARDGYAEAAKATRDPAEAAVIAFAQATLALARGDLARGWDGYEARFAPAWPRAVAFDAPGRRLAADDDLTGQRLLVVAEQGLGDELMFANVLPDVAQALGPEGRLSLAVEPRLVGLFQRSFPEADVSAHTTGRAIGPGGSHRLRSTPNVADTQGIELWAPMGSLPARFRRSLAEFADRGGYLTPDPQRVAHWAAWLGSGPPAVGLTWRSGKLAGDRRRQYPPKELWTPLLRTPGVRFVNLQYGDCADELAQFRARSGAEILEPPGLDLREDLEGLAALTAALSFTVAVSNATAALAGACGAPLGVIGGPANWTHLGAEGYPWYPTAEAFNTPSFADWSLAMEAAAARVAALPR